MSSTTQDLMNLTRCEGELHQECEAQITHPALSEYAIGSPKYEKLMQSIREATRFSWPAEGYRVNV